MKNSFFARLMSASLGLCVLTLLTGCFETTQEFTLNPDGSGKVVHECSFQEFNLTGEAGDPETALMDAVGKVLRDSKGVEAWRDVSYKRLDDGRLYFKGTAYFTNLSRLEIANQTMLDFNWQTADGRAVLSLRTDDGEEDDMDMSADAIDLSNLSPEEREQKIKAERAQFQQMKAMMSSVFDGMKQDILFHLPGNVEEYSNFTRDSAGALTLQFEGAKLLAAMEKLINDDDWIAENLGFTELKAGTRGRELGAQIQSFKEGWSDDGSQHMELKLGIPEETLKSLSLIVNGTKTELKRQGYFGGGNSYTFTFAHKTTFPEQGRLVAEVYDQLQTFSTPFKLEHISLMGKPLQ